MEQRVLERLGSKGIHESLNIKHYSIAHGFDDTFSNILSFNRFLILARLIVDKRGRGKRLIFERLAVQLIDKFLLK